jgi:hypothetical protein
MTADFKTVFEISEKTEAKPIVRTGRPGRPRGLPKTGGRQTGVPNKINGTIAETLRKLGCDPAMVLARIMANAKNDPELRRKCAADLMPYLHPRLSSVDSKVSGEMVQQIVVQTGIARLPTDPIDVTPALPAPAGGASPAEASIPAPELSGGEARSALHPVSVPASAPPPADPRSDTPVALPAGRPSDTSSSPPDTPRPALPSSPG